MRLAYQFQGQRSRSAGPLMLTHIVRHIFQTYEATNFKLGTRMEDDDPHQPQAPRPQRSRSQHQSEPSWPNAAPVSLEDGGGIPCRLNPAATLLVVFCLNITICCTSLRGVHFYGTPCIFIVKQSSVCKTSTDQRSEPTLFTVYVPALYRRQRLRVRLLHTANVLALWILLLGPVWIFPQPSM